MKITALVLAIFGFAWANSLQAAVTVGASQPANLEIRTVRIDPAACLNNFVSEVGGTFANCEDVDASVSVPTSAAITYQIPAAAREFPLTVGWADHVDINATLTMYPNGYKLRIYLNDTVNGGVPLVNNGTGIVERTPDREDMAEALRELVRLSGGSFQVEIVQATGGATHAPLSNP